MLLASLAEVKFEVRCRFNVGSITCVMVARGRRRWVESVSSGPG